MLQAALADVRCLLGVEGRPVFQDVAIIPRSIPQYEVGFGSIRQAMEQFEQRRPGLFLAGNYRDGISAGDSIMSGLNAIEKIRSTYAMPNRQFCLSTPGRLIRPKYPM